jgi:hypothetical protein
MFKYILLVLSSRCYHHDVSKLISTKASSSAAVMDDHDGGSDCDVGDGGRDGDGD